MKASVKARVYDICTNTIKHLHAYQTIELITYIIIWCSLMFVYRFSTTSACLFQNLPADCIPRFLKIPASLARNRPPPVGWQSPTRDARLVQAFFNGFILVDDLNLDIPELGPAFQGQGSRFQGNILWFVNDDVKCCQYQPKLMVCLKVCHTNQHVLT